MVESEKDFPYTVSEIANVVIDAAVPFPKYSERFPNFFNNCTIASKPEIT